MLSSGIVILPELFLQKSNHILYSLYQASSIKNINIRIIKLRCISAPRSWSNITNTVVLTILTLRHIQYLRLMYAEAVLVSSRTQVQSQIILNPDYLPDYLFVSYDYGKTYRKRPAMEPYFQRRCRLGHLNSFFIDFVGFVYYTISSIFGLMSPQLLQRLTTISLVFLGK